MPKRIDESNNSTTVRVRISQELRERCNSARLAGLHKRDAESSFLGYLLELGLLKYEKIILPIENADTDISNIETIETYVQPVEAKKERA